MNISSTHRQPKHLSSPVAQLDRSLAAGSLPENIYILEAKNPEDSLVLNQPQNDAIKLSDGTDKIRKYQSSAVKRKAVSSVAGLATAVPGALLGVMGVPGNPILGAAVGTVVGLALYWDANHRDDTGSVKVSLDGQTENRQWQGRPENYVKTPAELRTMLHSTGILGDRVLPAANPKIDGPVQTETLEALNAQKSNLQNLAKQRRLLADLGAKTRYGKPAFQLVSAATARDLLSRGQNIEVLSLVEVQDTDHKLTTENYHEGYSKKSVEAYQYTERSLKYQLSTIESPQDLSKIAKSQGLPESTDGVPTTGNSFTQTIYKSQEQAHRKLDGKTDEIQSRFSEAMLGDTTSRNQNPVSRTLKYMVNPSTIGYAAAGAALGATVGSGVPGLDAGAAATIGGVVGHFIGRAAVSRTVKKDQAPITEFRPAESSRSNLNKWAAIGAGAATGVGLGVLAAQAQGQAGEVSTMAVGAFGGACSGVLVSRPKKKEDVERAMMMGATGFIGGFGVGFAKMLGADETATTVALGALGGVLGGSVAALAMRDKR